MRAVMLLWCLASAMPGGPAQSAAGGVDLVVTDEAGAPMAGVRVELVGPTSVFLLTNSLGRGRVADLPAGEYEIVAAAPGKPAFRARNPVRGGDSGWSVSITLGAQGGSATVTERPLAGRVFRFGTGEAADEARPVASRDPVSLLQLVPGVVLDRLVVGDSGIGFPVTVLSQGASSEETVWKLDGMPIGDASALGQALPLFSFISIGQVRATTAGAHPARATAGVEIELSLRDRHGLPFGGSGYVHITGGGLQSENVTGDVFGQVPAFQRLRNGFDAGLEAGGRLPFGQDVFGWASYGATGSRQDVLTFVPDEAVYATLAPDDSTLQQASVRIAARRSSSILTGTYVISRKDRSGRDIGPTRLPESGLDERTTSQVFGASMTRTFSDALSMAVRYAHVRGSQSLDPIGGLDTVAFIDDAGVWHNTFRADSANQTQHSVAGEGTAVVIGQALTFGAGWRRASVDRSSFWPGGQFDRHVGYPIILAEAVRDSSISGHGDAVHAYVSDAFRFGPLAVDAGLRLDHQTSSVDGAAAAANPIVPGELPAVSVGSTSNVITWTLVSPRLSGSLPLGRSGRTVLRGSFGMFAAPLAADLAAIMQGLPQRSRSFIAVADQNGNQIFDPSDVSAFIETDITNSRVGADEAPRVQEIMVEVDRAIGTRTSLRAAYTFRRWTGFNWFRFDGVTGSDFLLAGFVTGSTTPTGSFDVPVFVLNPDALPEDRLKVFDARVGYRQEYQGLEITLARRPGEGWMWSVSFSGGTHREVFDSLDAIADPTPLVPSSVPFSLASPSLQAGFVLRETIGDAESGTYLIAPRYQMLAMASGPLVGKLDLTLSYLGRQGFSAPFFAGNVFGGSDATSDGAKRVLVVTSVDGSRLPMVHLFDLRASHPVPFPVGRAAIELAAFNLFNASTPLALDFDVRAATFNQIRTLMSPRIIRLGIRVGW